MIFLLSQVNDLQTVLMDTLNRVIIAYI